VGQVRERWSDVRRTRLLALLAGRAGRVVDAARNVLRDFYGTDASGNADFARIINERHWTRLDKLLSASKGEVAIGGKRNGATKTFEPTIVTNVSKDDALMSEELFGPILPIVPVASVEKAIELINEREKPLSMYIFSECKATVDRFLAETSAGSVVCNDVVVHLSVEDLPFGGVGHSGLGSYHGKHSFLTFSHMKPVVIRNFDPLFEEIASVRYPPYTVDNMNFLNALFARGSGMLPPNLLYLLKNMTLATFRAIYKRFSGKKAVENNNVVKN